MDIKSIQESFTPYSGLNLITRCIYLSRKKPNFSQEAMKIALKECVRCGYPELHKSISAQTVGSLAGYDFPKGKWFLSQNSDFFFEFFNEKNKNKAFPPKIKQ